jgi:CheY-like chemotaxis protein/CHASE3 domain sensor protein/putative methionine-R-sulfoxide reductase with GAF domain
MKMRTQLLLGYVVVFTIMIAIAGVMYESIHSLVGTRDLVDRGYDVMANTELLMRLLVDMESGERGYALTGDEQFLKPYETARATYESTMATLKNLVMDNEQMARIAEIEAAADAWHQEAILPIIEARRRVAEGRPGADLDMVIALIQRQIGEQRMDSIRQMRAKFVNVEKGVLTVREETAQGAADRSIRLAIVGTGLAIALGVVLMFFTSRGILRQVGGEPAAIMSVTNEIAQGNLEFESREIKTATTGIAASVAEIVETFRDTIRQANSVASGDYGIEIAPRSDKDKLRFALRAMTTSLKESRDRVEKEDWLKTGATRLDGAMRGDPDTATLASKVISEIANRLDAPVGAFYLAQEGGESTLSLLGSYAYKKRKNLSNEFKVGEGLVGQAALEKQQILVRNVPDDYIKVTSGLGEHIPRFICVTPFIYEGRVKGVVEIATLDEMTDRELEYLEQVMPALAVAVESAESRTKLVRSLEEAQTLSEELQAQQEELRTANEEMEVQTQRLEESEEKLKAQQEELQVTNEELEERNELLANQKREMERAGKELEEKARELAIASKYKSEFLANMSHELRTPLNSLLLLAQSLSENKDGNLTEEEVESARIIHGSGSDLLNLINEILDLSKIEAGRVDLQPGVVAMKDLAEGVRTSFGQIALEKGIGLEIVVGEDAPAEITSDYKRVEQVIRNLVSNAVKFTESGSVTVTFGRPDAGTDLSRSGLFAGECLAVAIKDTGIGITPEEHRIVFEAFQQVDGGTGRRHGGTGLGLSISRELVRLLGGEIQLESEPGKGSTFTLFLPITLPEGRGDASGRATTANTPRIDTGAVRDVLRRGGTSVQIKDDRTELEKDDRIILIVEDDPNFARILYRKCHEKGFKCLASPTGEEGLELASRHVPNAVILDIHLPGMDGWAVLSALKEDIRTRHIPVHIVSVEEPSTEAIRKGAVGHATKPLAQEDLEETFRRLEQVSAGKPGRVLVVEDDAEIRRGTLKLIGAKDVKVDEAKTGAEALEALRSYHYDCVVLDLGLPDMDGLEMLEKLEGEGVGLPPVIVHTARDLTREEEMDIRGHAESIVIKDVRSRERLLDEVSLFLHRVVSQMPQKKQQIIRNLHDSDTLLKEVKVLIVDDDMRTTFAMSHLLSKWGMKPLKAMNGERALRLLDEEPDVGLVLMDIMMPVMDGYETMKRIRAQDRFRKLPIIALTAKAMPEDREKCLAAGANDYLTKPVDQGRLISMIRVWLYR